MYVFVYLYMCIYVYTCMYMYTCIYVYTCVNVYIYLTTPSFRQDVKQGHFFKWTLIGLNSEFSFS